MDMARERQGRDVGFDPPSLPPSLFFWRAWAYLLEGEGLPWTGQDQEGWWREGWREGSAVAGLLLCGQKEEGREVHFLVAVVRVILLHGTKEGECFVTLPALPPSLSFWPFTWKAI